MAYYDPHFYRKTVALQVSLLILSTISVALRYLARRKRKAQLKGDDLWAFLSMLLYWLYIGFAFYGLLNGGGLQPELLPPSVIGHALKASYSAGVVALFTFTAAKVSVLLLYRRLFLVDRWFRTASTTMLVVCIMWFLASTLSYAFQCTPVDRAWQPLKDGHCFSLKTYLLAEEIPNCIIDIVIVLLPLGVVRKLQLPTIQKINLCFIFALGGFVSFISIIRMELTQNELSYGK